MTVSPRILTGIAFFLGVGAGLCLVRWIVRLTEPFSLPSENSGSPQPRLLAQVPLLGSLFARGRFCGRGKNVARWWVFVTWGTGLLFAAFVWAMLSLDCQAITEVRPDEIWRYGRILYHLVLIALLIAATGTDLREHVIPDGITVSGIVFAVLAATASGDLQMIHLWVDANLAIPGIRAAYVPQWIADHRHWHGLACSLTGMAVGGGLTWLVRFLSSLLLGQEALGFGDVTLMAMIGSFLGWQPVLVVFALAPISGILIALLVRLFARRTYVPYGPFLSIATLCVLFAWKWIWTFEIRSGETELVSLRKLFGDAVGLGILLAIGIGALILLLGLLRIYRSIPVTRRQSSDAPPPPD